MPAARIERFRRLEKLSEKVDKPSPLIDSYDVPFLHYADEDDSRSDQQSSDEEETVKWIKKKL
jgi:hypothetical protein